MKLDARDTPVSLQTSSGSAAAMAAYETALHQFQSYVGDPIATMDTHLETDPDFLAGHLLRGLVLSTFGERRFEREAAKSLAQAERLAAHANPREKLLTRALRQLVDNDWDTACRTLDGVLTDYPRDALALQTAHLFDFYRGDALNLRNRIARVLRHWDGSVPGYSYVLGMYAFGLEEMNEYAAAEDTAMQALSLQPQDGWAVHAAVHVNEMTGRIDTGIRLLELRQADWAPDNGFAFHNWWHLALFYLDRGDTTQVLKLYDEGVHPQPAPIALALVDATALLWRLHLEGIDLGTRFETVADEWAAQMDAESGFYAFNDLHAMLAFAATGRAKSMRQTVAAMETATQRPGINAMMTREVGMPLALAIRDYAEGRYSDAADGISRVRDIAHRFGGSHTQRDLLSLTLIEAARRAGRVSLARHVLAERLHAKPQGQWGERIEGRLSA
jgi:tetratricopeptide (TPR) repeat protein